MKRFLVLTVVVAALLFAGSAFAAGVGGAVKLGVDVAGKGTFSALGAEVSGNVKTGISIAGEVYYFANENVDIGGGVAYMLSRELEDFPGAKAWFLPIYVSVRLHPAMTELTPYGIAHLGYNFHGSNNAYKGYADIKGGLYWGLGGGVIFQKHFLAEIMYTQSKASAKLAGLPTVNIDYTKITLSVGYNF